ncbi:hypothetical protein AVEN_70340-1 [Araneus ventricosus]|uniref:Uncharacterized protein n=1 Tax=Araneus ventricosus TaxID=182803 RepID=A0A4Y2TEZ8_ARAVE|nr:hypothetical protein AVEN_70340-1 [Araneus ventricosus]
MSISNCLEISYWTTISVDTLYTYDSVDVSKLIKIDSSHIKRYIVLSQFHEMDETFSFIKVQSSFHLRFCMRCRGGGWFAFGKSVGSCNSEGDSCDESGSRANEFRR